MVEPQQVNGQPGAILRDRTGRVLGGRIQTIRTVNNPDKLRHIGRMADAWVALRRRTARARPRTDRRTDRIPLRCPRRRETSFGLLLALLITAASISDNGGRPAA